jgi:hypothetical protein
VRLGASVAIVGVAFLRELGKRAIAHSVCGIYSRLAVAPWRSLGRNFRPHPLDEPGHGRKN